MPSIKDMMGETFAPLGAALPREVPQPEEPKWAPMESHPGYERRGNEVRRAHGPKELSPLLNLDPVDREWMYSTPQVFDESTALKPMNREGIKRLYAAFKGEFDKIFPGD